MLKNIYIVLYTSIVSGTVFTRANQAPTLTTLCSRAALGYIQEKLNGHNWRHIEGQLRETLPQEVYGLIIEHFNDPRRYHINPSPLRILNQPGGVATLSAAGENQLIAQSHEHTRYTWDVQRGQPIGVIGSRTELTRFTYASPDQTIIVFTNANGIISVRHLGRENKLRRLSGHTNMINAVTISDDNTLLISGSSDETIRIWDIEHATTMHTCRGHIGPVNSIAISQDKKYIVSGGNDQTIRTWNSATGELISTVTIPNGTISSVAILTPEGYIASGCNEGIIHIWQLATQQNPLEHFSRLIASEQGFLGILKFMLYKYLYSIY
jgi:WD40 repeat protein